MKVQLMAVSRLICVIRVRKLRRKTCMELKSFDKLNFDQQVTQTNFPTLAPCDGHVA